MIKQKQTFIALLLCFGLLSCYKSKERNLSVDDLDTVLTYHADGFDFGAQKTFVLPDSIVRISNSGAAISMQAGTYDKAILNRIRQNMNLRGYVEEMNPSTSDPDLAILVTAVVINNYVVSNPYYYYDYWGWYGWNPSYGYGPGYGMYYPSPVYIDSFESGSLLINMVDPDAGDPNRRLIPVQWLAAVDGILENARANNQTRIIDGVDQAFAQSPYLISR